MRKPLKTYRVYFASASACVKIKAASAKEARTIAQDSYDRGELTAENAALRLLPEGRSIEAEFCQGENPPYISSVKEEIMKTIKIRVWREGTGKWHYCDDALPNLDARGPGYPTRPAAVRAARERYLDSPDPADRADCVVVAK